MQRKTIRKVSFFRKFFFIPNISKNCIKCLMPIHENALIINKNRIKILMKKKKKKNKEIRPKNIEKHKRKEK